MPACLDVLWLPIGWLYVCGCGLHCFGIKSLWYFSLPLQICSALLFLFFCTQKNGDTKPTLKQARRGEERRAPLLRLLFYPSTHPCSLAMSASLLSFYCLFVSVCSSVSQSSPCPSHGGSFILPCPSSFSFSPFVLTPTNLHEYIYIYCTLSLSFFLMKDLCFMVKIVFLLLSLYKFTYTYTLTRG